MQNTIPWHIREIRGIEKSLKTNLSNGLNEDSALTRLSKDGLNELPKQKKFTFLKAILKQLKNPLAFVLLFAAIATVFLNDFIDAFVIITALFVNVAIGVWQEGRAAKIFESLEEAQQSMAIVIRNGMRKTIRANRLAIGDIVIIESGFIVPADIRIINSSELLVDESMLTGEWVSVEKDSKTLTKENLPITKQKNMLWMGTTAVAGTAKGIVVAIGKNTQIGKIAKSTHNSFEHLTPLQKSIRHLARSLMFVILLSILAIVLFGVLRGEPIASMLLIAIAVAVAAMPEGLPASVTVSLALGMEKILKKGGLVKNLVAAETLGSTTVILTDKTGTLTEGVMELSGLYSIEGIENETVEVRGDNFELLKMAVLASDAFVEIKDNKRKVQGRPIERAIVEGGESNNIFQDKLENNGNLRIDFARFDPKRRWAASLNKFPGGENIVYITGSPEHILKECKYYFINEESRELTNEIKEKFIKTQNKLSAQGKRFTAIAYLKTSENSIPKKVLVPGGDGGFVFVGLLSFDDSIREDVPYAISEMHRAGVKVLMITGDHKETAKSVAIRTGIIESSDEKVCCTGEQIANMNNEELSLALANKKVFARVLPEQKLRIVKLLRSQGEVVAMTGDGINDAPALAAADIGLAVGSGTDVAKGAADLILLKDSFSIITSAISEGRRLVGNIKKIVAYLLSTSFGEIILIGGAIMFAAPLPILPTQILWANIIGGSLMGFPFAFEPREPGTLNKKPSSMNIQKILSKEIKLFLFEVVIVTGLVLLGLYAYLLYANVPIEKVRTMMFLAISVYAVFTALAFKNLSRPFWKAEILSNKYLLLGLLGSVIALVFVFTIPSLSTILSLERITVSDIMLIALVGLVNILAIELFKKNIFSKE